VFIPRFHFPDGYRVKAKGASVVSRPNAKHLLLRGRRQAETVTASVRPR
jgi:hypothetical protein